MNRKQPVIPVEVSQQGQQALDAVMAPMDGVHRAILLSEDGFEIASWQREGARPMTRLAAMASSLMSMAAAVGREIDYRSCRRLTFEAEDGTVALQAIRAGFPCILCLVMDSEAVLGRSLWAASQVAQRMGGLPQQPAAMVVPG